MPKANPLKPGKTKAAVAANIARLKRDGYPQAQAVAIALREARTPGRSLPHTQRRNSAQSEYDKGLEVFGRASRRFDQIRAAYRRGDISDTVFAKAQAVFDRADAAFDKLDAGLKKNPARKRNYSYPDIASIKKVLGASVVSRLVNATYPRLAISRAHERLMGKHDFVKAEAVAQLERYVKKAEGRRENPVITEAQKRILRKAVYNQYIDWDGKKYYSVPSGGGHEQVNGPTVLVLARMGYLEKRTLYDYMNQPYVRFYPTAKAEAAVSGERSNPSTSTSSDVRSPTKTSTSTYAHTAGNITVTGGAGAGATTRVTVRRNPTVLNISEMFQGDASGKTVELKAANGAPANLSRAGKLASLKLADRRATVRIPGAVVCIDTKKRLWLAGPRTPMFNRKANKGEGLDYGEIDTIAYVTAKSHVGNGRTFEYVHNFGEDGGRKPHLIIDDEGMAIIKGGDYQIREEGIID